MTLLGGVAQLGEGGPCRRRPSKEGAKLIGGLSARRGGNQLGGVLPARRVAQLRGGSSWEEGQARREAQLGWGQPGWGDSRMGLI